MTRRSLAALGCLFLAAFAAWIGSTRGEPDPVAAWDEVAPGLFRSRTSPSAYAIVRDGRAVLIDAAVPPDALAQLGVKLPDVVLLTHHHRDTVAHLDAYLRANVAVRAAKAAAEWLSTAGVAKYWADALPLRNSRTSYFVAPVGFDGVAYDLADGVKVEWNGWTVAAIDTPGHSRDHVAFALTRGDEPPAVVCGDAFHSPGKIWTPYTTDWDHWTDAGLKPAAESLAKLAKLRPKLLLSAHGPTLAKDCAAALEATAKSVGENGFLRAYSRFTERLGDVPRYKFLSPKEQIASAGEKPWAQLSEHLFITGNTYVLVSKEKNAILVVDPWAERSVKQIEKLRQDQKLGDIEIVWFSHAHYDHFDGLYSMSGRDGFAVWALDEVARPLEEPFRWRAPFLDARPIRFEKKFREGDTANWREYRFRFVHLPGQTHYTSGVETTIDGKHCLFTADNFFHHEQFTGTGGWMGLNRSSPGPYSESAKKVLDIAPEWVLAEHGGPFEFNAEDFRRRVEWGKVAAREADAISPSGSLRHDWNPHRVAIEPLVLKAKPGEQRKATLRLTNATAAAREIRVTLDGRGRIADQTWTRKVPAGGSTNDDINIAVPADIGAGRHIFALRNSDDGVGEGVDAFVVVEVE